MGYLMRLLLDTCSFIWLAAEPNRLSEKARHLLSDANHELFLSHASAWEIHMKHQTGKLRLPQKPRTWIAQQLVARGVSDLPIDLETIHQTSDLPAYHKDPFDRLIIAQAIVHDFRLLTPDPVFRRYRIAPIW
jgi:PIN domain nuclease of toxin-antitoxin system